MENEGFEKSVYSLTSIDRIKDNLAKDTILSVLSSVPVIGAFVDNNTEKLLTKFQHDKRQGLLDVILSETAYVTNEMVNNVEFILDFAKTLEAVNKLSSNSKVKFFGNLLRNSYLSKNKAKNYEFENNFQLLLSLSYSDIIIMESLKSNYRKIPDNPSENMVEFKETLEQTINGITNELQIPREIVIATLDKLSGMGVCTKTTYHSFTFGLSKSQVHYITSPLYLSLREFILSKERL